KVFLFDEPLSNLDAALRVQMRLELARLHRELQATMIYVTHDQVEAMTMADRIVVLNGGRIEQVGTPLELYHRPRNIFVAGFIGSPKMNLLAGRVTTAGADGVELLLQNGAALFLPSVAARLEPGAPITLGLRPEHLGPAAGGAIRGNIEVVERLGDETLIHLQPAEGDLVVARLDSDAPVAPGSAIELAPKTEAATLFNHSGHAITIDRNLPPPAV
ncbi:MAG TPA: TOBE domain-containing protein, partial [Pararhizobium sp.]|nr:TOBE domain-containing protein [Pararhizobium sp.]